MTTSGAKLLRRPEEPRRANFLELFFDLVFVVALVQLSNGLVQDLTWSGAFQTLVLLLAMWWVWSVTAWVTDLYDPQRSAIQLLVTASMLGSLVMVVALPDAFGERGLVFAGMYAAIHVGRQIFLVLTLRGHELQRRSVRVLFWFGVSAVPWIAGALAHGAARGALWTLAVAVDYTARGFRFPTPGLGRSPESEFPIVAEHLAERYRQLFVIALGELILDIALTLSGSGFAADRTARSWCRSSARRCSCGSTSTARESCCRLPSQRRPTQTA
ncbi:low temperature requirement protein A [Micromonospora rhizosphaerae]|uniref:low temperature requirement protein A n=1 Tax=Micromonospora rhizosphaerae TaxID=568872 RepID=UPI0024803C02|nr:low temperature requirement protein A [Micromonospora rhizosphaerae]